MSGLKNFFGVVAKKQTYLNMLYLFLSFPLGIIYFVLLVTGLALGFGLIITLLGIPILIGIMLLWHNLAAFERIQAKQLLGLNIPYTPNNYKSEKTIWRKLKMHISDAHTWKSFSFLFLKFPIGIASFVILVVFLAISFGFIATPILLNLAQSEVLPANGAFCIGYGNDYTKCYVTNYFTAFLASIAGIFFLFVSLHLFNGLAKVEGMLAEVLLNKEKKTSSSSVVSKTTMETKSESSNVNSTNI